MTRIGLIVPYLPQEETEHLFERCIKSIDKRFEAYVAIDYDRDGVSNMRNEGIDELIRSKVDYITFLDADDTMEPDAYDQMIAAIEEEPEEQIIQLNHRRRNLEGFACVKFFNKRGTYEANKLPQFWVGVWNKAYKAELIRSIRFVPGLVHGEDEIFNLECLASARRIYCSERIHMTHHSDNPKSLSKIVTPEDLMAEQKCLMKFMNDHITDRKLTETVRTRQIELWTNKVYREAFGGL